VSVVAVHHFTVRGGHRYGTVSVDLGTHRPINLFPDRETESVSQSLGQRPTVEVVCQAGPAPPGRAPESLHRVNGHDEVVSGASDPVRAPVTLVTQRRPIRREDRRRQCRCIPPADSTGRADRTIRCNGRPGTGPLPVDSRLLAAAPTVRQLCRGLDLSPGTVRR